MSRLRTAGGWLFALSLLTAGPVRAQDEALDEALAAEPQDGASMSFATDELAEQEPLPADEGAGAGEDADEGTGADDYAHEDDDAPQGPHEDDDAPQETHGKPDEVERVRGRAHVGFGMGMLTLSRPTAMGRQSLPRAVFAAVAVEFGLWLRPEQRLSYDLSIAYQSSLGLMLEAEPLFGLDQRVRARNQRAELAFAPVVRLGAAPGAWSLAFPLGFALRSLTPKLHQFGLPDRLLAGPLLRAELRVPLGEGVRLRLAPELVWLAFVDASLRDQGACCQGVAAGGTGALEADVGTSLRVALSYRQAHTFVGKGERAYDDMERFLTAGLTGRF